MNCCENGLVCGSSEVCTCVGTSKPVQSEIEANDAIVVAAVKELLVEKLRTQSDYYYAIVAEATDMTQRQYGKMMGLDYAIVLLDKNKDIVPYLLAEDEKVKLIEEERKATYTKLLQSYELLNEQYKQ